jgi:OOP family OmpA-OmpF porin
MKIKSAIITVFLWLISIVPCLVLAQEDMNGSRDHPKVPRIEGSYIVGYAFSDYDEGAFIDHVKEVSGNQVEVIDLKVEGERTRIVYVVPSSLSNIGIRRNYKEAFAVLGGVTEHFSCRNESCPRNLGDVFIWPKGRRIPTPLDAAAFYNSTNYYQNQSYWHATVVGSDTNYWVSVYSAERPSSKWKGQHFVHLEIVESSAFESALKFVNAEEMNQQIASEGRVALYGIQFDFDSAKLTPESSATIGEIAKALADDPGLTLYVVGHTDNEGSLQYNRNLSSQRAKSVVDRLVSEYGVDSGRLEPIGVGPVAPVASNDSEEGQSLNRRVELVKQ